MAEINDLNITDASNTARFPEGMAPSDVNDGARALEGILARWHKDINGSLVSAGSASAFTLSANRTIGAYYDGLSLVFETNHVNTGAATLNVDSVGAQSIVWPDGSAMVAGDMPFGSKVAVLYDADNTRWVRMSAFGRGNIVLDRKVTPTTVANTVTTSPVYSYSVPANTIGSNLTLRITMAAQYINDTAGAENLTIAVVFGGTTIFTHTQSIGQGTPARHLTLRGEIIAANSAAAQRATFEDTIGGLDTIGGAVNAAELTRTSAGHFTAAVDTTSAQSLIINFTHGTASANITATVHTALLELL